MSRADPQRAKVDSMCLFFHRTAVVMADGEVVSCANMFAENVGRLSETTGFLDIWNGPRLTSLRSCFGTDREWDQCRTCWFREVRYHSQRQAWARRDLYSLEAGSDYQEPSWDFRRYREDE